MQKVIGKGNLVWATQMPNSHVNNILVPRVRITRLFRANTNTEGLLCQQITDLKKSQPKEI